MLRATAVLVALLSPIAVAAEMDPHHQHHDGHSMPMEAVPGQDSSPAEGKSAHDHSGHAGHGPHDVGPAGETYDLRFIDAMVQHHTGALRMSEFVFDIGKPGIGSLAKSIWREQAQEIKAMLQWRKRWYPQAPVYPVSQRSGASADDLSGLQRMSAQDIEAMRMTGQPPSRQTRQVWFLEGMLHHHGGALLMAHDALAKSSNPTIRRFSRDVILAQRQEIIQLRRWLGTLGLRKPEYHQFDPYFSI